MSGRLENLLGAHALRAADAVDGALEPSGLTAADRAALVSLLNYAGGESIAVLRRGLGLSQPGSAHSVARLTRLGLVERRRSAADGRAAVLRLTDAGEAQARALLRERERALAALLAPLDRAERAALEALLEKLLGAREIDVDTARRECRLCDAAACGHPERCPVTLAVI